MCCVCVRTEGGREGGSEVGGRGAGGGAGGIREGREYLQYSFFFFYKMT